VAAISLPPLKASEVLRLPARVATDGSLSSPQLESIAYAARRFRMLLPSGARAGYYLGDGTGCGKGRVAAALMWHLWNSGARRHIWLSASADLFVDAKRDFDDLGASLPMSKLSSWPYGAITFGRHGLNQDGDGVIFATYHLLVASKDGGTSQSSCRLAQLIAWMQAGKQSEEGECSGLIVLDEAHRAKNIGTGTRSGSKAGCSALELQRQCPNAAVLYASATGATEIRHLGYLERLGLWGSLRPHKSFEELQEAVEGGGFAAMELLAMTMKAEGMLSCRSLSFHGCTFRLATIEFASSPMAALYSAASLLWQDLYALLMQAYKLKKRGLRQRRVKDPKALQESVLSIRHFWNCQQQFFRQMLLCAKVKEAISLAQAAVLRGESVVIALWSTGESMTQARDERLKQSSANQQNVDADFASAPREIAQRLLDKCLEPMLQQEDCAALQPRCAALRAELADLDLPVNPLDDLIDRLGGPSRVAELTGRSKRLVNRGTNDACYEERGEGVNLQELQAFQSGSKHIVIITEAASAGISLHADRRLPTAAQRPRYMISMELPWEADKAIQQLGRVHRSNQVAPPKFALVVTDLGGEVRFVSAIARRLRMLGAMMRGDRNSAHGSVESLTPFDVQNRYGRKALNRFYELLRTNGPREVDFSFIHEMASHSHKSGATWTSWESFAADASKGLEKIGLRPDTEDKFDESLDESRNINVFLNRILMLPPVLQNGLFDAVAELYAQLVDAGHKDGSYDKGLEHIGQRGKQLAPVSIVNTEVLHRDPHSTAETTHVTLRIDNSLDWAGALKLAEDGGDHFAEGFYWKSGGRGSMRQVVLAIVRPRIVARHRGSADPQMSDGDDDQLFDLYTPMRPAAAKLAAVDREALSSDDFQKISNAELPAAERAWKAALASGSAQRWTEEHVLSGSVLNTWSALSSVKQLASRRRKAGAEQPHRIPLVRAQLVGGGAVVGVRVQAAQLPEVRHALASLLADTRHEVQPSGGTSENLSKGTAARAAAALPDIEVVSQRLEVLLEQQPMKQAAWNGWTGAHQALVDDGLLDGSAPAMELAKLALEHLDRNGKIDLEDANGVVKLRDKPKGCGWYIPPPKKPKTSARGKAKASSR